VTSGVSAAKRLAAVAFAKKGAKVVIAGRREEAGKALVQELRSFGSEAEFINADVRAVLPGAAAAAVTFRSERS
jgi:NADP-dependent 3-hydroxy acid dehydrogenase YdfG